MEVTPKITTSAILVHLSSKLSNLPVHVSITQLLPSTSLMIHVTTNPGHPRLSDVFVVSMPRGKEVLSSRLEGLGGLDDDIDRLARLLSKRLGRQCFVSGYLGGIVREGRGEVVGILCRTVEQQLQSSTASALDE